MLNWETDADASLDLKQSLFKKMKYHYQILINNLFLRRTYLRING
jgi:hypothetical protein